MGYLFTSQIAEIIFGGGLGIGYLTNLRFAGSVGSAEILMLIGLLGLIAKSGIRLLKLPRDGYGLIIGFVFVQFMVVTPLVTGVFWASGAYVGFRNVIAFAGGVLVFYVVASDLEGRIDVEMIGRTAIVVFVVSLLLSVAFLPQSDLIYGKARFTGGAKNPNQLAFYLIFVFLLASVFLKRFWIAAVAAVFAVVSLFVKSDALYLAIVLGFCWWAFLNFVLAQKFRISALLLIVLSVLLLAGASLLLQSDCVSKLDQLWMKADHGGARLQLYTNSLKAIGDWPLTGRGGGHFSWIAGYYHHSEAHNTILDFAMQTGVVFPVILFGLFLMAIFVSARAGHYSFSAALVVFFCVAQFHFMGRHFIFWFVLALFVRYLREDVKKKWMHYAEAKSDFLSPVQAK